MNRRTAIRTLFSAGAGSFFLPLSRAVQRGDPQDFVIRSEVRLVLLDVTVKNRDGTFASGLLQDNFAVFENGVAQRITAFANNDLPVTAGILVDESRSMTPKRADVLSAAETFIASSNPRDEIFVLNFNEKVTRGLPASVVFSDNLAQLRSALYRGVPEGRTALYDAVVDGLDELQLGKRDKKALLLISDGGDNVSVHTRDQMFDLIERSIATIYTIGLFDAVDPDRNPGVLKQLASISGGQAYFPASPADMTAVCRGIAREIRTRYTIGYVPAASNGGSLRQIRVRVSVPGRTHFTVRARTRYRYDQAAS